MVQLRDDVVGLDAAIIMSPKVWEASGHLDVLHRPARRVPATVTSASARITSRLARSAVGPRGGPHDDRHAREADVSELRQRRVHRAAPLQPDVQDPHGSRRGRGERGLPAPGNRSGHVRRLRHRPEPRAARSSRSGSRRSGSRSATRSRPGTSSSVRASSSRWRWSSSSSPGTDETWHEYWINERMRWYTDLGIAQGEPARREQHAADELVALLEAARSTSSTSSRSRSGASSRGSRTEPTST